jgi:uncharacterized membrane protein YoaK (UPF0700 family)
MSARGSGQEPVPLAQQAARSLRHPLTQALLALTFTTGLVDGVSYLGLGHVFTANMTGNVVLLGFGLAGGSGLPVLSPIVSLLAFLLGAGTGGRLSRGRGRELFGQLSYALVIEVGMLVVCTVIALATTVRAGTFAGDAVIALLAFAMGVRNATVRRVAVPDLTTTVLTMTLTGLAAESPPAGGTGAGSARRLSAVLAMLVGALVGALTLKTSLAIPLALASGLALATWLVYLPAAAKGGR